MKIKATLNKIGRWFVEVGNTTKTALENLENLWLSIALGVSAYYNYDTLSGTEAPFEYYVRVASSASIGLAALWLFWKHVKRAGN